MSSPAFEPLSAAARAIRNARLGVAVAFDDGPIGDIERDALVAGLPAWVAEHSGWLYLAANVSWPGCYKIGCTRRTVSSRMRSLSATGLVTPWVAVGSWWVYDAHGLEAKVLKACADWLVKGEIFGAASEVLTAKVEHLLALDLAAVRQQLTPLLLPGELEVLLTGCGLPAVSPTGTGSSDCPAYTSVGT